jgi:hypothetical protein
MGAARNVYLALCLTATTGRKAKMCMEMEHYNQDWEGTRNVILRCLRVTIVAVEKL